MIKNYYETLELTPKATQQQIAQQYRKLALRNHPKFTKENPQVAAHVFTALAEAFEVLSDPLKRAFFDKYGYEALKEGLYADGKLSGGYRFANNPDQIFDRFFKNEDSLNGVLDLNVTQEGSLFGHAFGGLQHKPNLFYENLIVEVPCYLEQLYKGTTRVVEYQRKIMNSDGRTTTVTNCSKKIHIKPGYGAKTLLSFPEEGHQTVHRTVSNLIFQIKEIAHPNYSRSGSDLIYTHRLSLADALSCSSLQVRTLDGRTISVGVDQIVSPRRLQQVVGQGLPNSQTNKRGNLFVRFQIIFPVALSEEKRSELRKLLA